ncbi:MAG: outer membrane beta-barrel protein [Alistipes sp.]|nr:outer membrane beta-barrel protein [Alistipes sp.]
MKYLTKISLPLLTLLVVAVAASTASAQHTLGVFGGVGSASMRPYPKKEMKSIFPIINGGISWRYYSLPRYVGAVGVDIEYLGRGFQYGHTYTSLGLDENGVEQREYHFYKRNIKSIMVPIVWQPHVYLAKNRVRLYMEAALTFSYNFGGDYSYEIKSDAGDYDWRLERDNRWNYGLAGGGGFALLFGRYEVGFRARYYFGYADILKNSNKYYDNGIDGPENPFYYNPLKSPLDNMTFNITFAYRFNKEGFDEWFYKPKKEKRQKKNFNFSESSTGAKTR